MIGLLAPRRLPAVARLRLELPFQRLGGQEAADPPDRIAARVARTCSALPTPHSLCLAFGQRCVGGSPEDSSGPRSRDGCRRRRAPASSRCRRARRPSNIAGITRSKRPRSANASSGLASAGGAVAGQRDRANYPIETVRYRRRAYRRCARRRSASLPACGWSTTTWAPSGIHHRPSPNFSAPAPPPGGLPVPLGSGKGPRAHVTCMPSEGGRSEASILVAPLCPGVFPVRERLGLAVSNGRS
jgi:hypothetical protein